VYFTNSLKNIRKRRKNYEKKEVRWIEEEDVDKLLCA